MKHDSMDLDAETDELKLYLEKLADTPDDELLTRYTMQRPGRPPGLYWQLRWLAGRVLRWLESRGILHSEPWPVSLKHADSSSSAKPLLIWAVGIDRETLREACDALSGSLHELPGFAPVLVTDVADFAYFSRLGWIVEYMPRLGGHGEAFEDRKLKHVARLYRGAPVLPAIASLEAGDAWDQVVQRTVR